MNVGNRFARIENNTVGYGEITVEPAPDGGE